MSLIPPGDNVANGGIFLQEFLEKFNRRAGGSGDRLRFCQIRLALFAADTLARGNSAEFFVVLFFL